MSVYNSLLWIVVAVWSGTIAQIITNKHFQKKSGVFFSSFEFSVQTVSRLECVATCSKLQTCVLVSYNDDNNTCKISNKGPDGTDTFIPDSSWNVYYDTEDNCDSSFCQNGGSCNDLIGSYYCTCADRYTGANCESVECPPGYSIVIGTTCYRVVDTSSYNFYDAQALCTSDGAHLLDLQTTQESSDLQQRLIAAGISGYYYYMGATDLATEGTWIWSDGTPVSSGFANWDYADGQPDAYTPAEDCSQIRTVSGFLWNDVDCTFIGRVICEYP